MAGAAEIKQELIELIRGESDTNILEAIKTLLSRKRLDAAQKEKLIERAMKSEEDIKAGRTFTQEEAIKRTDGSIVSSSFESIQSLRAFT